ncbi:unnamed protein product [Urochloa humidicola]
MLLSIPNVISEDKAGFLHTEAIENHIDSNNSNISNQNALRIGTHVNHNMFNVYSSEDQSRQHDLVR